MDWIPDSVGPRRGIEPIPLWLCTFCGYKWNQFQSPQECPACGRTGHIKRAGGD